MAQGYIKSLDGLRGLAILIMMSYHAAIFPYAWVSMQLFFVLSGFLITSILWHEKFKSEPNGYKFKKFWVRRALRIFPLYFAWLVLLGATYLFLDFPRYYSQNIPYLATYTFNYTRSFEGWQGNPLFTHLWSLCVEEQFYLFFPVLLFFLPTKWIKGLVIFFVFLSPVARYVLVNHYLNQGMVPEAAADAVYWNTLSHLDAFSMGGMIAIFSLQKKWGRPGLLLAVAFAVVVLAGALNFISEGKGFYFSDLGYRHNQTRHYEFVWHYSLLDFFFASLVLFLVSAHTTSNNVLQRLCSMPWLVRVGKVSYGMYIFHWALMVYVFNKFIPSANILQKAILFIPYSITLYLIAEISFRWFESPFLYLKDVLFPSVKENNQQKNADAIIAAETTPAAP